MAADKVGVEPQRREPCGTPAAFADSSVQLQVLPLPPKGAAGGQQPSSAAGCAPGPQTCAPSVMVIAKAAPPALRTKGHAHMSKGLLSQVASISQPRTVMITVPRSAAPRTLAVTPQLPPSAPPQPANIQLPPGEPDSSS